MLIPALRLICEALKRPGVMSPQGVKRERACKRELKQYFALLAGQVEALNLGELANSQHPEAAASTAEIRLRRVLHRVRPVLVGVLSTNIYLALFEGDKVARAHLGLKEAAGDQQQPTGQPIPPLIPSPPAISIFGGLDTLGLTGQAAAAYAATRAATSVTGIDQTTLNLLRNAIQQGITDRLGVPKLAKLIQNTVMDMSDFRSQMIASTEMNDAFSEASLQKLKRLDIPYKEWVAAPDACDICADNDGEVVLTDDAFPSGDDRPPAHPLCRCAVVGARAPAEMAAAD